MVTIGTAAAASGLTLGELPPPAGAHLAGKAETTEVALLDATVKTYSKTSFQIVDARHFGMGERLAWQQVVEPIQNQVLAAGGKRVYIPWQRPGHDLIEVFRLDAHHGLVAAMEHRDPPGKGRIVGYYAITMNAMPVD